MKGIDEYLDLEAESPESGKNYEEDGADDDAARVVPDTFSGRGEDSESLIQVLSDKQGWTLSWEKQDGATHLSDYSDP